MFGQEDIQSARERSVIGKCLLLFGAFWFPRIYSKDGIMSQSDKLKIQMATLFPMNQMMEH